LLARYYQNLSLTAIAERDHIPLATAKSRLARAHALIRERLDRASGGDRSQWQPSLLALLGHSSATPPASAAPFATASLASLLAMKIQLGLGLVIVSMVALGAFIFRDDLIGDRNPSPNATAALQVVQTPTSVPDQRAGEDAAARAVVNVGEASAPTATTVTVGEYLKHYYGDRWPEMEKGYADWCLDIGEKVDLLEQKLDSLPPPWESVAEGVKAKFLTNDVGLKQLIQGQIQWPAGTLTELQSRRASQHRSFRARGHRRHRPQVQCRHRALRRVMENGTSRRVQLVVAIGPRRTRSAVPSAVPRD
jgi:hypothetical protein